METALKGLEKAIATGRLKDRNKMERRLGKIQARHPQVNAPSSGPSFSNSASASPTISNSTANVV